MDEKSAKQRAERLVQQWANEGAYIGNATALIALIAVELLAVQRECADKLEAMIPEKGLSRRSGRYKWLSYAAQAIRGETK